MYASQVWATPFLQQNNEMDNPLQKWLVTVLKIILMVKDTTSSWCIIREYGLEPLQFNWFQAAVRLYHALTRSNSSTARKIIQADMQLSSPCDDCWSSHNVSSLIDVVSGFTACVAFLFFNLYILPAMNGLTQSYLFKTRLLKCEPIDLNRFVVDLRERYLDYWTPYSDMHPRKRSSKHSTYHQWCALPTKRALVIHIRHTPTLPI